MELYQALKKYEDFFIFEKGLSNNTFLAYHKDLLHFLNYLKKKGKKKIEELSFEDIIAYIQKRSPLLTKKSINREKSTIKNFLGFCHSEEMIENDFTNFLNQEKNDDFFPEVLTQDEVKIMLQTLSGDLLNYEKHSLKYRIAYRDELMLELLYALGLRVSELVGLLVSDIDLEEGWCQIRGKGNKIRILPILPEIGKKIYSYQKNILYLFSPQKPKLFLNKNGQPLSRISIWKWIKQLAIRANIKKNISPHTFRHTCATHLIQNGADIRIVQELIGHANIQTTELYTHLNNQDVRNIFTKYHPLYY